STNSTLTCLFSVNMRADRCCGKRRSAEPCSAIPLSAAPHCAQYRCLRATRAEQTRHAVTAVHSNRKLWRKARHAFAWSPPENSPCRLLSTDRRWTRTSEYSSNSNDAYRTLSTRHRQYIFSTGFSLSKLI